MTTVVSICTDALLRLADRPINSLLGPADRQLLSSNLYPQARDWVIRRHPGNSCIKRVSLAPLAAAPAFDYAYQFLLPADALRVLSVGEEGTFLAYKLEGSTSGRVILSDDNPCLLRYVFRNEDPATWDAGLVEMVTSRLTVLLAYPITKSISVRDAFEATAEREAKQMRAVDGQEDVGDSSYDSPLISARRV